MRPIVTRASAGIFQQASRRAFTTARPSPFVARARGVPRTALDKPLLRQSFRRSYADAAAEPKAAPKKKRAGVLRWLWRATYISAIGGLGYVSYGIWDMRNPADQEEPDPSKKTLVVLGAIWLRQGIWVLNTKLICRRHHRNGMGLRVAAQEA